MKIHKFSEDLVFTLNSQIFLLISRDLIEEARKDIADKVAYGFNRPKNFLWSKPALFGMRF